MKPDKLLILKIQLKFKSFTADLCKICVSICLTFSTLKALSNHILHFEFRKGTLLVNNIFALIAALLLTLGERAKSFEMLIIGRLVIGVDSGKSLFYSPLSKQCSKVTVEQKPTLQDCSPPHIQSHRYAHKLLNEK